MVSSYNLLPNECVLGNVADGSFPEAHSVRVYVETGLDERHGGILQVELVLSRERVVHTAHSECLFAPEPTPHPKRGKSTTYLERRLGVEALDDDSRTDFTHLQCRVLQTGRKGESSHRGRARNRKEGRLKEVAREFHS